MDVRWIRQPNSLGSTQGSARTQQPATPQNRPESQRTTTGTGGAGQGRQAGMSATGGQEGRNVNQLDQDHQARQFGEARQRAFSGDGGGWGGLEAGLRGSGGEGRTGGGFHRR